jgi:pyruvate dehydrogenase E1 component
MWRSSQEAGDGRTAHLLGSGAIRSEVLKARQILEELGVATDVWSVTSYNELNRRGLAAERRWLLAPETEQRAYVEELLEKELGIFVAASDYMKALPLSIARWVPGPYVVLGTDGYGLCESRADLRAYFEVSAEYIASAALASPADVGAVSREELKAAPERLAIGPDKPNPAVSGPAEYLRETRKS